MYLKKQVIFSRTRIYLCLFLCLLLAVTPLSMAHPTQPEVSPKASSPKARLDLASGGSLYRAFSLPSGSTVRISSDPEFAVVTALVSHTVKQTYSDLEQIFGLTPTLSIDVKLLPEEVFFLATQAPSWTNALYYDGTIIVPVRQKGMNTEDLKRSIRHEFTHAMISAFTGGNAPGWFDEGFAQMMEGPAHPALAIALAKWVAKNPPLPLHLLQNGFTKLETKYVVPAYAQSFWAVQYITEQFGFLKMRLYFDRLKQGSADSFKDAFGLSEAAFEDQIHCALKKPACLNDPQSCRQCNNIQTVQVRSTQ